MLIRPPSVDYANAQIQDYGRIMPHRPPLRLTLEARFSHSQDALRGTAGFGFWNAPFAPALRRIRLPKSAWFFFGSPPLDLPFAQGVPGYGFKAATLDVATPLFMTLLPLAPLGVVAMRVPPLYRTFYPIAQHAIRASEAALQQDMTLWHHYQLDWTREGITFHINGEQVHHSRYRPRGRLGFVAWIDNQYAIVTPQGRLGWGLVNSDQTQELHIRHLNIRPGSP
ncbi:MAG: hypothetical protein ACLFTK_03025 [Anaerolineales bacterium]